MKTILIAAVTADGFIAKHATQTSTDWTSGADKAHFRALTKQLGTLVMGSTTFDTIGRVLPGRRCIVMTSRPAHYSDYENLEVASGSATELHERLSEEGVEYLAVIGGANIYGQFMAAGLVDELYITVEPRVFGRGISLFGEAVDQLLHLVDYERLGDDSVLLHYEVER